MRTSSGGCKESLHIYGEIPSAAAGQRLDQALAALFPEYSRSRIQAWIRATAVRVNGAVTARQRQRVRGGEWVEICATLPDESRWCAEEIPLAVVYTDDDLLVIDKPPHLVAHPAPGNPSGTLVNALLNYAPELAQLPRAGLIHRLDKDTTGLLVVARTLTAHHALTEQLKAREITREYVAVVSGVVIGGGRIDAPIGRDPLDRKKMAVVAHGRPAVTHYRVERRFAAHTYLRLRLETGRTHQIRVHLRHLGYPLVGDPAYGGGVPAGCSPKVRVALRNFSRQALHALRLELSHPRTGARISWDAPLPADLSELIHQLD